MYKMKLPLILVFNKNDVVKEDFCFAWINDYEELMVKLNLKNRILLITIQNIFHHLADLFVWC